MVQAMSAYGSCWCCAQHGIVTPAVSAGLCSACIHRSPSACKTAHQKEAAT